MMVAREYRYLILSIAFSHVASYTLMGPKFYVNRALPSDNRGLSNLVPSPFRTYQPSLPIQYYGRYFNDPYFTPNLSNDDYFYGQDPYSSSFTAGDNDYYANFMTYYVPTSGGGGPHLNYYEPSSAVLAIKPIDESRYYEYAEDGHVPRSQRQWWLDKNIPSNEDADYEESTQINGILFGGTVGDDNLFKMGTKKPKLSKTKAEAHLKPRPKSRYVGIDGFGRKKYRNEPIYGNYRKSPGRNDDEYVWEWEQYDSSPATATKVGRSQQYERDDTVNELKQLAKQSRMADEMAATTWDAESNNLAGWASGNEKRNANLPQPAGNQRWKKSSSKPNNDEWALYNEGGRTRVPQVVDDNTTPWNDEISRETFVFDTIKNLLASEDRTDLNEQRLNKLKNQKTESYKTTTTSTIVIPRVIAFSSSSDSSTTDSSSNTEGTTAEEFPNFIFESKPKTSTPSPSSTVEISKRFDKKYLSVDNNFPYNGDVSLVRQLSKLRHRSS